LEAIFLLAPDPDGALATALAAVTRRPPAARAELDGVAMRLWVVADDEAERLAAAASRHPLYIADGHHRYETAIAYARENPRAARQAARARAHGGRAWARRGAYRGARRAVHSQRRHRHAVARLHGRRPRGVRSRAQRPGGRGGAAQPDEGGAGVRRGGRRRGHAAQVHLLRAEGSERLGHQEGGGNVSLNGKKVLLFAGPLYEDLELWYPKIRL